MCRYKPVRLHTLKSVGRNHHRWMSGRSPKVGPAMILATWGLLVAYRFYVFPFVHFSGLDCVSGGGR